METPGPCQKPVQRKEQIPGSIGGPVSKSKDIESYRETPNMDPQLPYMLESAGKYMHPHIYGMHCM